jgi:hypothetical protein
MKIKPKFQKLAQEILNSRVNARLVLDGVFGPRSVAAARQWILWHFRGGQSAERWVAAVIQKEAIRQGINAGAFDAFWGPQTEDAAYRLRGTAFARPDEAAPQDATPAQAAPLPVRCWTPSDAAMTARFGAVGSNQVVAALPFPMRLDWDLSAVVGRASMHRLFQGPVTAALEEIRDHYRREEIRLLNIDRFGGILNVRKKRGGSTWSAHAWGTAIDLWPAANKLAWKKDRAAFAREEYRPMREAFARAGLMSLGRCYDFDWMHWQLNP